MSNIRVHLRFMRSFYYQTEHLPRFLSKLFSGMLFTFIASDLCNQLKYTLIRVKSFLESKNVLVYRLDSIRIAATAKYLQFALSPRQQKGDG